MKKKLHIATKKNRIKKMNYDCKNFSKVKEHEVHDVKMYENMIDDDARDNILSGELNREDYDEMKRTCINFFV